MRAFQFVSLVLGLAISAQAVLRGRDVESSFSHIARARLAQHLRKRDVTPLGTFLIRDMATSVTASNSTSWTENINCMSI